MFKEILALIKQIAAHFVSGGFQENKQVHCCSTPKPHNHIKF